jgi:hypothetical protein
MSQREGFKSKTAASVATENCLNEGVHSNRVVDFVAVRAQAIYKDQQTRDRGSGEIQFKALKSCEFQQASINRFICFGSRGVDLC